MGGWYEISRQRDKTFWEVGLKCLAVQFRMFRVQDKIIQRAAKKYWRGTMKKYSGGVGQGGGLGKNKKM